MLDLQQMPRPRPSNSRCLPLRLLERLLQVLHKQLKLQAILAEGHMITVLVDAPNSGAAEEGYLRQILYFSYPSLLKKFQKKAKLNPVKLG